jgi:uncharacterized DUF497 family protein
MQPYEDAVGFDWNSGNLLKVWDTHLVRPSECEEVFANRPFGGAPAKDTAKEERHLVFGKTNEGRLLAVVYTMRNRLIRVISPRPMSRKERKEYAEAIAAHP